MSFSKPQVLSKFQAAAQELGWANAILYGLDRALEKCGLPIHILHYRLVAQPVSAKPHLPGHRGKSILIRRVAPDHCGELGFMWK